VAELAKDERPWALVGLITTMLSFTLYLLYQWKISGTDEVKNDKIAEITVKNINSGKISLLGALGPEFEQALREHHALRRNSIGGEGVGVGVGGAGGGIGLSVSGSQAGTPLTEDYGAIGDQDEQNETHPLKASVMERLRLICRPFFHKYDWDLTGTLDKSEVSHLFADLGEAPGPEEMKMLWERYDKDKDDHLDFNEFVELIIDHSLKVLHDGHHHERRGSWRGQGREEGGEEAGGKVARREEDEEEEEEMPEDLKDLPWETQQRRLKMRSFYMMAVGTILILIFSDPLIGVLSEVGERTKVPAFYISFILSPLVSNGAEVLAAYAYSQKKSSKTITISLSTLMGAAIMNATFVLFIFLLLIYVKRLAWTFSAETIAILFVQIVVGLMALSKSQNLLSAVFILGLYPFSLVLVYVLENVLGFD
jgi:Ca2+/Na+ antiporter